MRNRKALGNILLLLTAMIWGTAFVAQRAGMESIEPLTFTAARMWPAALAVGLVALTMKRRSLSGMQKTDRKKTIFGGICCGLFLVSATIFQQTGIVYTTAGKAGFITAMYMLLVPVVNFLLFGKKNTWLVWLAVLTGVAGMYLLCITEGFSLTKGDSLVCICEHEGGGDIHAVQHGVYKEKYKTDSRRKLVDKESECDDHDKFKYDAEYKYGEELFKHERIGKKNILDHKTENESNGKTCRHP